MSDLTTLSAVKDWLAPGSGSLSSGNDTLLKALISRSSAFVLNYLNRSTLAVRQFDEYMDSGGREFILLRQCPVVSVSSIQFAGLTITAQATGNPPANGFILEPISESFGQQRLSIYPNRFPQGRNTVRVVYRAGFQVQSELSVISSDPVAVSTMWLQDDGVTIDGVTATAVSGTPSAGQYSVVAGVYTFATADAGRTAAITYSCVPQNIEQAVIELAGERFRQRDRIGHNSKSLPNGETVNFLVKDMSDYIRTALQPYRRVTPA